MNSPRRYGDVLVLPAAGSRHLAIACDSLGGIGPKPGDTVRASGYVVGRFSCRVPLMELLALGAEPVAISCCLCVEPEPLGREIMTGVREELRAAGLAEAVSLTGSTEKNVATSQTGVGMTVVGMIGPARWGLAGTGDLVLAVGEPRVGGAVALDDRAVADIPTLRLILGHSAAGDVVPVGSRGIAAEARDLAFRSGLCFVPAPSCILDLAASAGPSTVLLVTAAPGLRQAVERHLAGSGRPVHLIGTLGRSDGGTPQPVEGNALWAGERGWSV